MGSRSLVSPSRICFNILKSSVIGPLDLLLLLDRRQQVIGGGSAGKLLQDRLSNCSVDRETT